MPAMQIRGNHINYRIIGDDGPWIALSPGGRRGMEAVESLAGRMANAGYRVVIHDRRNCGASDVAIDGEDSEYELWADDLHMLLSEVGALPVIIGGASSGCRTSILFALRHAQSVRALLLWRVTGGAFAAERLAENYYGQHIEACERGGMAAVCEMEHFRDRITARPENRDRLMAQHPDRFVAVMSHWRKYFLDGADLPVIGATEQDLGSIAVPTLIVPGNDLTHGLATGRSAHRLIPGSEIYEMWGEDVDIDLFPIEEWDAREDEMAAAFIDFLARALARPSA